MMSATWDELLDEARAGELTLQRARERWLVQQAREAATFLGTILDLAEGRSRVGVRLVGGHRHDGELAAVGADVVVLADRGDRVAVSVAAVETVRPLAGTAAQAAAGDRVAALDLRFGELLARIAGEHPEVAVAMRSGDVLAGTLVAVGADVLSVRVARDSVVYVSTGAASSVRLRSG